MLSHCTQLVYRYGLGGLGAALVLIHMYVDPIKKAMQAMWAVGFAGSVGIALTTGKDTGGGRRGEGKKRGSLFLSLTLWAHSLTYALTHSRTHALTHSRTHALTHSRTHALTHSRTHELSILVD